MENEKIHALVNDLLPNYIDHLTSAESNRIIEDHLAQCPSCKKAFERMKETSSEIDPDDQLEIDYLKKVRKKNIRNILMAVGVVLVTISLFISVWTFVIGTKASISTLDIKTEVKLDEVVLNLSSIDPDRKVSRVSWNENNGEVTAQVYMVPGKNKEQTFTYVARDPIEKVEAADQIVWENGEEIPSQLGAMYAKRVQYIGDAVNVSHLLQAMSLSNLVGNYTIEIDETRLIIDSSRMLNQDYIQSQSLIVLSLIQNATSITWRSGQEEQTVYVEELNEKLRRNIKEGYGSVAVFVQNIKQIEQFDGAQKRRYALDLGPLPETISDQTILSFTIRENEKTVAYQSMRAKDGMNEERKVLIHFILPQGDYTLQVAIGNEETEEVPLQEKSSYTLVFEHSKWNLEENDENN